MRELDLYNNQITDISFLGSLTNLTTLHLGYNQITDISFLGSLTNLTTLNLNYNQIADISFLGSLTNLTTLRSGLQSNCRYQLPRLAHQSDKTASQQQ